MLTKEELGRIAEFTRQYLYDTGAKRNEERIKSHPRSAIHRWQHTLNVLHNAEQILVGENASDESSDIVRIAAIMHDISRFTCPGEIHARVSGEIAEKYLTEQGYPSEFVKRVAKAISEHGTGLHSLPPDQRGEILSWEGKVLIEADNLDKLGVSAITDALLMMGKRDLVGSESLRELIDHPMQRAGFVKEYMWTETSKRMAEQRFAFFQKFVEQLADEVVEDSSIY